MSRTTTMLIAIIALHPIASAQHSTYDFGRKIVSEPVAPRGVVLASPGAADPSKKSQAQAVLYSLLLPGMGEWYAGRFDNGRYSLIAEATLWLTYVSFRQYGGWLQDDARSFATVHAGAMAGGKDDQFFVDVGNFSTVYDYNEKKLRDRNADEVYDPSRGYFWSWDSELNRERFRTMRISRDRVFNNSRFVVGAIVVNHVLSALNAARLVRHYNGDVEATYGSLRLEPSPAPVSAESGGARLVYTYRF